ncbi:phosphatase PAP2 family protein [Hydrogenothermus marinus]|uniref:PAP2 superfamily protein n=1 Tax=Hydrogenothermus marinus TaxID=133270 RepID=A0A3M0BG89_9AQUI|nr:phosphatase PAP2 family protein [Hydrogenothermus marinus]RMA96047.1 PAP2 superfamily protein [Hydrogenothermus marinus]
MSKDWQLKLKWNIKLFRFINNKRSKFLDKFYKKFFLLGKSYSLILFLPIFYYFGKLNAIYQLIIALLITGIVMPTLKYIFRHKRPVSLLEDVYLLEPVSLKSFPSADTAYAFTLFSVSLFFFPLWAVFIMFIYALLIAFGRIYMGAHFPIDVVVGAFIGFISGIISHLIFLYMM